MKSTIPEVTIGSLARDEKGSFKIGPFGSLLKKGELIPKGIPVVGIENILPNNFVQDYRKFITQEKFEQLSQYQIEPFDILVTTMGTIGRAAVAPENVGTTIIDSHLFRMRVDRNKVEPAYLCYALNGYEPLKKQLVAKAVGAIMAGLNTTILKECTIPLPPLDEQKRIAKRLNEELSAVETARKAAEEQLHAAWELPSAYLREVFSDLPKERMKTIEEVCEIKGGKRLPSGTDFAKIKTNHPYIRVLDFENGTVNTKDLKYIDEETHKQIWRYIINKEDIYLSIAGTIGVAGIIPDELDGAHLTENACRLVIKDKQSLDRDYLAILLQSALGQEQIKIKTNQVGQPKLALTRIATISLPLPSLEEQKRISSFLTEKLFQAKELEAKIEAQLEEINALPSALLGRAFSGGA